MASLSFTNFSLLNRFHSNFPFFSSTNVVQLQNLRFRTGYVYAAISRRKKSDSLTEDVSEDLVAEGKASRSKQTPAKTRKKSVSEDKVSESIVNVDVTAENSSKPRRGRKKAALTSSRSDEPEAEKMVSGPRKTKKEINDTELTEKNGGISVASLDEEKKVTRRGRPKKKTEEIEVHTEEIEIHAEEIEIYPEEIEIYPEEIEIHNDLSDEEEEIVAPTMDDNDDNDDKEENDLELITTKEEEDISFTYGWPPLVCCFGVAQHAFVPCWRPANRLVDYEIHERMKDVFWVPEKFIRSPGGCTSNVAVALASLGGKVAFMGKLGDDDLGQSLLYYLNANKVQTRSVRVDSKKVTAVSHMKIVKRGGLRMNYVKPCAQDSLTKSEINIDVLKEAKMFYFNTFSLLDRNMRSTTLRAVNVSKKLGGVIFYDPNLPLPLWESSEETKQFIKEAWESADIIEVTKQELEFLCGIEPSERFNTKDYDKSKFIHYESEVIATLWHDNLKILFVTNGSSKIHYYTKEHNGFVRGMEDAPLTPFTSDMSATGDGIVAGLMRMLTLQPHLITDEGYLKRTVRYAIDCGIVDQWLLARKLGYPPKDGMEVTPDSNGIKALDEKAYRTLVPVS